MKISRTVQMYRTGGIFLTTKIIDSLFCGCGRMTTTESLRFRIVQNMFESLFFQVRSQYLCIDRIPPTVCTLNDNVKVVRVNMHVMFFPVFTDSKSNFVFHVCRNRMLRCIHVCDLRMNESLRKLLPRFVGYVIILSDIETPNIARWLLKDS